MCDPISAVSAAATVGGGLLQGKEAADNGRRVAEARNAATMAEVNRAKGYGDRSRGVFDASLSGYSTDPSAGQAASTAAIAGNAAGPDKVGTISSGNGPQVVADREASRMGDVFTRNAGLDTSLGTLKGYNRMGTDNQLRLNQSGRDIDMIGDFAKTSSNVNGIEQRAAATNAVKAPSPLGQILQTAGQIGSFYGGKGVTSGGGNFLNFNPVPYGANRLSLG